jgi:hypothetical protein
MKVQEFFLVILAGLGFCGCNVSKVSAKPAPSQAQQLIVLIDLSASRSQAMEADARSFLHDQVEKLSFGDELVLMQMQQSGLTDNPRKWKGEMPVPVDPRYPSAREKNHRKAAQEGMLTAVDSFFKPETATTAQHTDILTTLQLAGERVHDAEERASTILVLSDMLQSAQGIEMEKLKRMPRPEWLAKQKSLGLIPNLSGVCVVVIGADITNAAGVRVRDFWRQYFNAAGALLADTHYRVMPPPASRNFCS